MRPSILRLAPGRLAGLALILLALALPDLSSAQGYAVRDGDTLLIEVAEDPDLNRRVLVTPDGTITFPFAGSVDARGRTVEQIRQEITAGLRGAFAEDVTPTVFVSVASLFVEPPEIPEPPAPPPKRTAPTSSAAASASLSPHPYPSASTARSVCDSHAA